MAAHIEPAMKHLFQSFKPKSYGDFGCETCHGNDMEIVDFHMPNSLYALPEKDTIAEATSYDEETTKFMTEKVVPTFAKLLSESPKEPGSAGGVTCFTCHPHGSRARRAPQPTDLGTKTGAQECPMRIRRIARERWRRPARHPA
jgi:hypothetical protein